VNKSRHPNESPFVLFQTQMMCVVLETGMLSNS